jgi:hypothetical protein
MRLLDWLWENRIVNRVKELIARLTAILPRPLDPVRSIKMKLGVLVVVSGLAGSRTSGS